MIIPASDYEHILRHDLMSFIERCFYELNPQTTLTGTGPSTGTNLASKVQLFMAGWQRRF